MLFLSRLVIWLSCDIQHNTIFNAGVEVRLYPQWNTLKQSVLALFRALSLVQREINMRWQTFMPFASLLPAYADSLSSIFLSLLFCILSCWVYPVFQIHIVTDICHWQHATNYNQYIPCYLARPGFSAIRLNSYLRRTM